MSEGRLIIAPVGLRPTGVLGPLCSKPVRSRKGDHLLLLATPESKPYADKIKKILQNKGFNCTNVKEVQSKDELGENLCNVLVSAAEKSKNVLLLANGATVRLFVEIVELLRTCNNVILRIVHSRDYMVFVHKSDGSLEKSDWLDNVGLKDILELLDLVWDESKGILRQNPATGKGTAQLEHILRLEERAGFLFAMMDASRWDTPHPLTGQIDRLTPYRANLLAVDTLRKLGLESRRVLLWGLTREPDKRRAAQDLIPFCSAKNLEDAKSEWRISLLNCHLFRLPEEQYTWPVVQIPEKIENENGIGVSGDEASYFPLTRNPASPSSRPSPSRTSAAISGLDFNRLTSGLKNGDSMGHGP